MYAFVSPFACVSWSISFCKLMCAFVGPSACVSFCKLMYAFVGPGACAASWGVGHFIASGQ